MLIIYKRCTVVISSVVMYSLLILHVCGTLIRDDFGGDVRMYHALVLDALFVSLLFDNLSGHSYPFTFLMILSMEYLHIIGFNENEAH